MIKFFPILLPIIFGLCSYYFSLNKMKKKFDQNSSLLSDPLIKALVKRIETTLNLKDLKVYILDENSINGLATIEGKVYLTKGFLDKFYEGKVSAEELSSVIAHELGHLALGHTKRRVIDFTGQNALRVILALTIGRIIPAVGVYIANLIVSLLASKISRNDEFEADAYAAALLLKSGIGIKPQIDLLKKLDKLVGTISSVSWLSSHPKTEDRIKALEKLKNKWN